MNFLRISTIIWNLNNFWLLIEFEFISANHVADTRLTTGLAARDPGIAARDPACFSDSGGRNPSRRYAGAPRNAAKHVCVLTFVTYAIRRVWWWGRGGAAHRTVISSERRKESGLRRRRNLTSTTQTERRYFWEVRGGSGKLVQMLLCSGDGRKVLGVDERVRWSEQRWGKSWFSAPSVVGMERKWVSELERWVAVEAGRSQGAGVCRWLLGAHSGSARTASVVRVRVRQRSPWSAWLGGGGDESAMSSCSAEGATMAIGRVGERKRTEAMPVVLWPR